MAVAEDINEREGKDVIHFSLWFLKQFKGFFFGISLFPSPLFIYFLCAPIFAFYKFLVFQYFYNNTF